MQRYFSFFFTKFGFPNDCPIDDDINLPNAHETTLCVKTMMLTSIVSVKR